MTPEGLPPAEVGKELHEHAKRGHGNDARAEGTPRHERVLSIVEAVLLSLVAVLAAYSGYAAAKWGTESSVSLAHASATRTKANRADFEALQTRTFDSVSFNAGSPRSPPETPGRNGSRRDGFVRAISGRSTRGLRPTPRTTRTRRRDRRSCLST